MLELLTLVLFLGLFAGILFSLEVGFRIGCRSTKCTPERGFEGLGAMEAAIFSMRVVGHYWAGVNHSATPPWLEQVPLWCCDFE